MMAEVRRGRVLVFTKAGEFAFNHVADSQGNYWLADDAESAIAERDAEIERLRSALVSVGNRLFKKVDSQFICVGMVSWQRLDEASEVINDALKANE